jgi:hypothetical protein
MASASEDFPRGGLERQGGLSNHRKADNQSKLAPDACDQSRSIGERKLMPHFLPVLGGQTSSPNYFLCHAVPQVAANAPLDGRLAP